MLIRGESRRDAGTHAHLRYLHFIFNLSRGRCPTAPTCLASTSVLAAKGLWNVVSRMAQDKPFVEQCLESGVIGKLCGAARGATDLLAALDMVRSAGGVSHSAVSQGLRPRAPLYPRVFGSLQCLLRPIVRLDA